MTEQITQDTVVELLQELRSPEATEEVRAKLSDLPFDQLLSLFEQAVDDFQGKVPNELVIARNNAIHSYVDRQLKENKNGHFTINLPFKNVCKACSGAGERYLFYRLPARKPCKHCQNGKIKEECPKCKGSGRFITTDTDLRINVKCHDCGGKGYNVKACQNCTGTGKVTEFVPAKIAEGTPCDKCKGLGIHIPARTKTLSTPVLTAELATKIKTSDVKE